jgi:long-subunit fatty acid transport protein
MGMPNRHYATGHPDVAGSTPGDQAPGPQRYDVVEQEGLVLFPSLGAAYRVHDLIDVGGRFSWGFGTIQGESDVWAVGNGSEDPGRDGVFHFDVTDYTLFQWSLGVLVRPTPNVELGAMYASKVAVRAKGTSYAVLGEWVTNPAPGLMTSVTPTGPSESDCKPNEMGTPAELNTCINFDLPMRANAGARLIQRDVDGRERGDLELDVRWEQWSTAKDVGVIVDGQDELTQINLKEVALRHGFRDTWSFLLGGSWRFDMGEHALIGRAGAGYELGAAPHQWTRLDYDGLSRIVVGLGAGYELANFRIDAGINYFQGLGRDVKTLALPAGCMRTDCHPQPSPTQPLEVRGQQDYHPFNAGRYDARYVIGTVGVTAWY